MKRRAVIGVICVAVTLLAGCASDNSSTNEDIDDVVSTNVEWLPCGAIECARIDVPRVGSDVDGDTIKVSVYRRLSSEEKAPVLMLLPDRTRLLMLCI